MGHVKWLLFPFSIVYWILTSIRNWGYDTKILPSCKVDRAVIAVGNLSVGGTGKTPHIEYLIRLLKDHFKVATLSRGFGRKQSGFQLADDNSTARKIGDEPLQLYKKFGRAVTVAVEVNRVLGAVALLDKKPETQVLLLDDSYQHRAIQSGYTILLTDYSRPYCKDVVLPVGTLRESRRGRKRADVVIVTKCPPLDSDQKKAFAERLRLQQHQKVYFSHIRYGKLYTFHNQPITIDRKPIIVVTGIANARPLIAALSKKATVVKHFAFADHHPFKQGELEAIHRLFDTFADGNLCIVTTEKDAMRLMQPPFESMIASYPWCYQTIEVELNRKDEFCQDIRNYVERDC